MNLRPLSLLPLSLYVLLALVVLYPQSIHLTDTVAYGGDALEASWTLAWNARQIARDPLHLFDANILYPNPRPLGFTDHRLGLSLLVAPVFWLTENAVLGFNVALLAGLVFTAMAGRYLAVMLGLSRIGAWAAGALYAFHTYQIVESPRLHVVIHGFLPLVIWQLLRLIETGRSRHAFAAGGLMLLQGLCSSYHLLYGSLLVALVMAIALAVRPRATLAATPKLFVAALVAAFLILPLAVPMLETSKAHGYARELAPGVTVEHYLSTTSNNIVYGALGGRTQVAHGGPHFVGFVSLGLAALAVGSWLRRREPFWIPGALGLFLLFFALSLGRDMVAFGHELGPGPYRLLYDWVPGFQLVRNPERLAVVAMLFFALLAGRGVDLLARGRSPIVGIALAVLVPLEHISSLPRLEQVPVGEDVPAVYRWLAASPARALAELPVHGEGLIRKEAYEMYFSTYHFRPMIHGYESYPPLLSHVLRRLAGEFPSERALLALEHVGVDTLVVHHGREGDLDGLSEAVVRGRLEPIARFENAFEGGSDEVFRIVPAEPLAPAPFPEGRRLRSPEWRLRASGGKPELAQDADGATAWKIDGPLEGGEFVEVVFERPVPVSGVVLPLRMDSAFPARFHLRILSLENRWVRVASFDDAHVLQLLDRLRQDPSRASIGFARDGRKLLGVRLEAGVLGESFFGWSIPEVEIWVRD